MSDSATGPFSGYLFQFEKALVLLATLEKTGDTISVELIDDVALQNEEDLVLMAIQAKHSLSPNGTTFEDTSNSLWRTLQIWIQKIKQGIFSADTQFICSTNKKIPTNALIRKIKENTIEEVKQEISDLLAKQKQKLQDLQLKDPTAGPSIKKVIKLIEFSLANFDEFTVIKERLTIHDDEDLKEKFFSVVHMTSDNYTVAARDSVFEEMYGWIANRSKAKWLNAAGATFSKKDFDNKFAQVFTNPAITSAVFRKKSWLGSIEAKKIADAKKELFVRQIEDIKRNQSAKERKIEAAILDFLYHDIEMTHIIANGNFTKLDFGQFKLNCKERWQTCYDSHVRKELEEYNEEKNDIAISILDSLMDRIELTFKEGITFNSDNKYIHNGTFLKLSNEPEIGWHPDWELKYKNNA